MGTCGRALLLAAFCMRPLFTQYVPLRPIYLLLSSAGLSSTLSNIYSTLLTRGMRSVAVCFGILWLLAAMFAATVLRSQGNGVGGVGPTCTVPTAASALAMGSSSPRPLSSPPPLSRD